MSMSPIGRWGGANTDSIAHQMGVASPDDAVLPSGRPFKQIVGFTLTWLADEGYIRRLNGEFDISRPWNDLILSEKGLSALNAVPPSIGKPVGSHLRNLSDQSPGAPAASQKIAEVVGSFIGAGIGAVTKSMSGA